MRRQLKPETYKAYKKYNKVVFRNKRKWRLQQARLPVEVKISTVVDLQKLAYEIARSQGRSYPLPWGMIR